MLIKNNKVVYLHALGDWSNLPTQTSTTVGTIPMGYRPVLACSARETKGADVRITIDGDGVITAYNNTVYSNIDGNYSATWITP